jgi:uncharacterized protein YjiS (DUF1127 family)
MEVEIAMFAKSLSRALVSRQASKLTADAVSKVLALAFLLAHSVLRELQIRRDMRRLMEMDDAMLRDIGIVRSDIERSVRTGRDRVHERKA